MTLHTKYRPTTFDEVIGQDGAVRSLEAALDNGTSRTFLLSGPSGTGKTTLARIVASALECAPMDITEIDAATFTGIDAMRSITRTLAYKPLGSDKRVIIIDECHALSKAAWQSLLKALEEPPEWLYWFLCTTDLAKVPANIKTRCASLELKTVPQGKLVELLSDVAEGEGFKGKDLEAIIDICAHEAKGSPRQAIVNLGVCAEAKDKATAAELLKSASEKPEAINLALALLKRAPWRELQTILNGLKDTNAESIRQVVRAVINNKILAAKSEDEAGALLEVLDAFSEPMYDNGIAQIVMAVGRIKFGG